MTANALFFIASLATLAASSLSAASISWTSHNITGQVTDISTKGALVEARNGTEENEVTVNGVTFQNRANSGNLFDSLFANDQIRDRGWGVVNRVTDQNYSFLLSYGQRSGRLGYNKAPQSEPRNEWGTVTLTGLIVGKQYEIQIFASDCDVSAGTMQSEGLLLGNGSQGSPVLGTDTLLYYEMTEDGVGQYGIGTFVADAATQTFNVRSVTNLKVSGKASISDHFSNGWQIRDLGFTGSNEITSILPSNKGLSSTLLAGQSVILGSEGHSSAPKDKFTYHISLNASNQGFAANVNDQMGSPNPPDGKPFQVAITEPIQGYRFVNAPTKGVMNTVLSSGLSISMITRDALFDSFNANNARIWTTTDPKSDLLNPAGKPDVTNVGIRDISHVTGSIDISGLASGTIHFFYGGYNDAPSIIACMVDSDGSQPNISVVNFHNGDHADRNERYMSSITFVNDAGYDSIEYDFAGGFVMGSSGRWDGIIVSGKPLP